MTNGALVRFALGWWWRWLSALCLGSRRGARGACRGFRVEMMYRAVLVAAFDVGCAYMHLPLASCRGLAAILRFQVIVGLLLAPIHSCSSIIVRVCVCATAAEVVLSGSATPCPIGILPGRHLLDGAFRAGELQLCFIITAFACIDPVVSFVIACTRLSSYSGSSQHFLGFIDEKPTEYGRGATATAAGQQRAVSSARRPGRCYSARQAAVLQLHHW